MVVSHHMLMGLQGGKQPEGFDENESFDTEISSKMSKSKPETCLYVHDTEQEIKKKIASAFCPVKVVEGNPVLDYCENIIFRKTNTFLIERPSKFGGNIEYASYATLEKDYREGNLHPADLKAATATALNSIIAPVREHFEKDKHASELYNFVKSQKITR